MTKENNIHILSIVAIVAIVAVFATIQGNKQSHTHAAEPAENIAGQAIIQSPAIDASLATPLKGTIFVTSARYQGDLGGRTGADLKCQNLAEAADHGGVWKAILSDSQMHGKDALLSYNLDKNSFYNILGDLISPNLQSLFSPGASIDEPGFKYDEDGMQISGDIDETLAWTGMNEDGTYPDRHDHCDDWSSNDPSGNFPQTTSVGEVRLHTGDIWEQFPNVECSYYLRLYCVQVAQTVTPPAR